MSCRRFPQISWKFPIMNYYSTVYSCFLPQGFGKLDLQYFDNFLTPLRKLVGYPTVVSFANSCYLRNLPMVFQILAMLDGCMG
jgi:hypothetical protein